MFEIRTNLGVNFGSFKDLLRYMKEENITTVDYTTYYVLEKMTTARNVKQADIEEILRK